MFMISNDFMRFMETKTAFHIPRAAPSAITRCKSYKERFSSLYFLSESSSGNSHSVLSVYIAVSSSSGSMSDDEDEISPGGVGREATGFASLTRPLSFRFLFCFLSLTMSDSFRGMIW